MLRFLPGILLLQIITFVVVWINTSIQIDWNTAQMLKIALPIGLIGVFASLWFDAIAKNRAAGLVNRLTEKHAREREKLHVRTEREKTRVLKDAQKTIVKEQRRANNKANRKVGVAFVAAAGAGMVMIITELITLGLVTLTTAGGALSGYLYRGRKESSVAPRENDVVAEQTGQPRLINPKSAHSAMRDDQQVNQR